MGATAPPPVEIGAAAAGSDQARDAASTGGHREAGAASRCRSGRSRECGAVVLDAERMPPTGSLALVLYSTLLTGVNLVVVIPTADDYARRLGGGELFSGLIIGALPLFAGLGIYVNQIWLMRWMSLKSVLLLLAVGSVLGNVLYSLAGLMHFKWTLFAARCLVGFCNGFNLPSLYIGLTVGMKRRSEIILYFSALNTLGYALGPALAAMLDVFVASFRINNLVLDADTAPGWFMAILYLLFMVKVIVLFEDVPMNVTSPQAAQSNHADSTVLEPVPAVACCACLWYLCVSSLFITCVEVYAVTVGQNYWGWTLATSAMFLSLLMLCSGLINLFMGIFTKHMIRSDRKALLVSSVIACACCALLFNFNLDAISANVSILSTGLVLVLILSGLIRAFGLAASSKIVPTSQKAIMNTWATEFMTVGRGAGGIIGSILNPSSFFPVVVTLFAVTLLTSVASHSRMQPSGKAK